MTETRKKKTFNLRTLRLSLKYRPEILRLILKMRQTIKNKQKLLTKLKHSLKEMERKISSAENTPGPNATENSYSAVLGTEPAKDENQINNTRSNNETKDANDTDFAQKLLKTKDKSTQTNDISSSKSVKNTPKAEENEAKIEDSGWNGSEASKSIAEQVKEAAQDALKDSGMVYVESAGMYYDYKTGYYYNSELGLYYHTDTGCYYYYSDEKKSFVFHSYPDRSATNEALLAHEKRKAKKHKMERRREDDIENLTKNLSQDSAEGNGEAKKAKRKKTNKKKVENSEPCSNENKELDTSAQNKAEVKSSEREVIDKEGENKSEVKEELEDGECSDTNSEGSDDEDVQSNASTHSASDDESVAKHHPPCMRVIVRETSVAKLRVGNLYIVTKDGGTVGREGDHHAILLKDHNVSRDHLDIKFDVTNNCYLATDLGSKNGTLLNGTRMSESQIMSQPMQIVHGSTLQIGETKLLCHIHAGNDTCGHCEPGLLMEATEKEKKVAYTRTCNVQKQHQLELARLKNKYAPKPLAIEETAYNDRAQARREKVGSSHHAEKTQSTDVNTSLTSENKGFKLLEKMGWNKGEGLGKDNQGETEPVPLISNEGTAGLGASRMPAPNPNNTLGPATIRLAARTKMLKPPAKAFQSNLDEDEDSE